MNSRYSNKLECKNKDNSSKNSRRRCIHCFYYHPKLYSKIRNREVIDKTFLKKRENKLSIIINKNTIKCSYSCMDIMENIITKQNKKNIYSTQLITITAIISIKIKSLNITAGSKKIPNLTINV